MAIQTILDDILRMNNFRTVKDLEYIPSDNCVYVSRRFGAKSTLIDISDDHTEEMLRNHIRSVDAIY